MSDSPFGFDTLTISAALVSDDDPDSVHDAAATVGPDAVKLPVVLVPEGGTPPGGDYMMLGVMMRPNRVRNENIDVAPAAREPEIPPDAQPRTRYRLTGGQPPTPGSDPDPTTVGVRTWRGMARSPKRREAV